MNSNNLLRSNFEKRLSYFGGAITANIQEMDNEFQDLEVFFIDATLMMCHDVRVTQTFLNWLTRYGAVLCPSKIRKLLRLKVFDQAVLGAFTSILIENDQRPTRWLPVIKFAKKGSRVMFEELPIPKNLNPHFKKWGIIAPLMLPNENKYLLPSSAILKKCIELKYRAMMVGTLSADVFSFMKKSTKQFTAYEIAKLTSHHRAQVYLVINLMRKLGSDELIKYGDGN